MLYFVAEAYCFGNGVDTDLEKGINYLNQAYNFGNGKAANLLGTCYSKGLGVEKNLNRAFELYEEAVNRGSVHAFGNIGVHYLRGWGCESDADKASAMFVKGAEEGDPVAALYLAKCLETGIGNNGKPDLKAAQRWYVEAAKNGNEGALSWCRENGVKLQS
ncbi:sel1 repeat family protein [Verrucomicrobiales bacterium]|nr:sel1 repeat family protein [Verrucomicrobiales bacterium]MDB4662599.1 sel1 repeat family protein [Verrucomicrobiales bacterium]MDC0314459.1 sel1 repeat family protein [bacterium]MDC0322181.1 sel1 repeat family protein [Verrucomicrobiales bacterium]